MSSSWAGDPFAVLPDDERDGGIQTPAEFFGFEIGSRHLRHAQATDYWKHLASVSDRVQLIPYATSHGGRPLMVAAISSAENLSNLDSIRQRRRRLTSGKFKGNAAQEMLVMYMGYSVHGDEASAINAAPLVAYHLASSHSETVNRWLDQSVFLVDPALNPDGVDRFANWANENRGKFPNSSDVDREHVQPWPGGRTNYYWFDLNRDWLPTVHPESQGRLRLFHQWKPNVVLDFHEMSGTASYFFQPGIPARNNPLSPKDNLKLTRMFAAEHAASMDAAGELYFTEERFDDFYVGKGSTYPDLHGAIGILFEQGSTRGLKLTNSRTDRHFRDTVANQVRTSLSSLRVAGESKTALLEHQADFYRAALERSAQSSITGYLLTGTPSRLKAAANLLRTHAIRVYRPTEDFHFGGRLLAASNAMIIPTNQPEATFIESLMEPLESFEENIFYDVSTWHLPSAFDLQMQHIDSDLPESWLGEWQSHAEPTPNTATPNVEELAGFAIAPVELTVPSVIAAIQRVGGHVRVATEPMTLSNGSKLPAGTFLILKQPHQGGSKKNWTQVANTLLRATKARNIEPVLITSGLTSTGPDLGSSSTLDLPTCNPLLVVGEGTSAYEAGALWHYLDVRMRQPSTRIDADRLSRVDLRDYSCIILPSGGYSTWGTSETQQLSRYVREGGTVIAVSSSIHWLEKNALINVPESREIPGPISNPVSFADAASEKALETIAGAFFETRIDPTHPLGFGFEDDSVPVFRDHELVFAQPENPFGAAAKYERVIAGYVSDFNRRKIAGSTAVWVENSGQGRYIMLVDNPVFRGYVRSSERFLSNAILLGPAISVPTALGAEAVESSETDGHNH